MNPIYEQIKQLQETRLAIYSDNISVKETEEDSIIYIDDEKIKYIYIDSSVYINDKCYFILSKDSTNRVIILANRLGTLCNIDLTDSYIRGLDSDNCLKLNIIKFEKDELVDDEVLICNYPIFKTSINQIDNGYESTITVKIAPGGEHHIIYTSCCSSIDSIFIDNAYILKKFQENSLSIEILYSLDNLLAAMKGTLFNVILSNNEILLVDYNDNQKIYKLSIYEFISADINLFDNSSIIIYENNIIVPDSIELSEDIQDIIGRKYRGSVLAGLENLYYLISKAIQSNELELVEDLIKDYDVLYNRLLECGLFELINDNTIVYINKDTIVKYLTEIKSQYKGIHHFVTRFIDSRKENNKEVDD